MYGYDPTSWDLRQDDLAETYKEYTSSDDESEEVTPQGGGQTVQVDDDLPF